MKNKIIQYSMHLIICLVFLGLDSVAQSNSLSNAATLKKVDFQSFENVDFLGNAYDVFIVKVSSETLNKFSFVSNSGQITNDLFLSKLSNLSESFLINASISDDYCKPIGYFVNNGQKINPINLSDGSGNFYLKPNGALLIGPNSAIICESNSIGRYKNIRLGIQSGPLLINNGVINSQFSPASGNVNIRCGVGMFTKNNFKYLVFAKSKSPISFYEFSQFFKNKYNTQNALCIESQGCILKLPNKTAPSYNGVICNYLKFY